MPLLQKVEIDSADCDRGRCRVATIIELWRLEDDLSIRAYREYFDKESNTMMAVPAHVPLSAIIALIETKGGENT